MADDNETESKAGPDAEASQNLPIIEHKDVSVYHMYTPFMRKAILGIAAFLALLTPFTDTVYLPALTSLAKDFDASDSMAALTVSIYLAAVGVGQILWGPLSDRYGRAIIIFVALIFYEGITIGCIFSPSIEGFLALRSIQGFIVGSTIIIAQASIADVFPPNERGEATGAFLAPMLVGPVIAPIIGGFLSQAFGWRSTFVLLAILGAPAVLLTILLFPETHHFYVNEKVESIKRTKCAGHDSKKAAYSSVSGSVDVEQVAVEASTTDKAGNGGEKDTDVDQLTAIFQAVTYDPNEALYVHSLKASPLHILSIAERDYIPKPTFTMPWEALSLCIDPTVAFFLYEQSIAFAIMFSSMTLLPIWLAEDPYNMSENMVGITFLAVGIGMLIGAVHGGMLSDYSAAQPHLKQCPEGRLYYTQLMIPLVILGGMGFAYSLQYGANLGWVLASQFVLGYGQSAIMSGVMAFLTAAKPSTAAAASAVSMFLCFAFSAVCTAVGVTAAEKVELSGFFWILSGILLLDVVGAVVRIFFAFSAADGREPVAASSDGQEIAMVAVEDGSCP